MNCKRCGAVVFSSASFCEDCGAPVAAGQDVSGNPVTADVVMPVPRKEPAVTVTSSAAAASGTAAAASGAAASGAAAAARPAVLPGTEIRLGDGEVVWRQYQAVRLRNRRRGQGILYVTDSRVVFYAWARGMGTRPGSALIQQVKLEDVSGFSAYISRRVSVFLMLLAAVFSTATVTAVLASKGTAAVILAILAVASILTLFTDAAQRGNAGVTIHSREAATSPVAFGGIGVRSALLQALFAVALFFIFPPLLLLRILLRSYTAFDVASGRPGDDSAAIIAELGALIMDLQTRGTFAGEHWGVQQPQDPSRVHGVS